MLVNHQLRPSSFHKQTSYFLAQPTPSSTINQGEKHVICRLFHAQVSASIRHITQEKRVSTLLSSCQPFFPSSGSHFRYFTSKSATLSSSQKQTSASDDNNTENQSDKSPDEEDFLFFLRDKLQKRNKSVLLHPESTANIILPEQMMIKESTTYDEETKEEITTKKAVLDAGLGGFWMVKDLKKTESKPILTNPGLIPAHKAELFPIVDGFTSLKDDKETINLPNYFIHNDGTSQNSCTLVAISFKDFGFKMLENWITAFEQAFSPSRQQQQQQNHANIVHLNIMEEGFLKMFSGVLKFLIKRNTPEEKHENTLLYSGKVEELKDILRMHNTLCGYVVLVDGTGHVRWMASGRPDEKDLQTMISCAKELLMDDNNSRNSIKNPSPAFAAGRVKLGPKIKREKSSKKTTRTSRKLSRR